MNDTALWRKCSNCKETIGWQRLYWVCSVSTCNRQRTGLVFCSVSCWDAHVPIMRHKDAWAEERHSPARGDAMPKKLDMSRPTKPRDASARSSSSATDNLAPAPPDEVLVVASKVKAYIRARSGMNTSADVMVPLSSAIRRLCDEAIRSARRHERKTVLARDVS